MMINIGIFLIVVTILIIFVCILSYLKIIFDRVLNEDENDKSSHFQDSMLECFQDFKSATLRMENSLTESVALNRLVVDQLNDFKKILQLIASNSNLQSENIAWIVQKINDNKSNTISEDSNSSESVPYDKVAYNDAVIAFQNVNNAIYSIRKHKMVTTKLLDALYSGINYLTESDYVNLDESSREKVKSVESKINMFNDSYRKEILKALKCLGSSWEACVRFPLNKEFNNDFDENILGESVDNGLVITRVIALGYEFPNSVIIGRIKTKVL